MTDTPFGHAPTVVLIDGGPSPQGALGQRLRRRGVALHRASTAREGIGLALAIRPDVLVLGDVPAEPGGVGLLRAVRREEAFDAVPVIVLAAGADAAARRLSLRAGANDVMAAPADPGELAERIQAQLRMGQARRAALEMARVEERRRLAREVHDRLGQLLTAANIDLRLLERRTHDGGPPPREELLQELRSARSSIDQAIASVQYIAQLLRRARLEAGGLAAALRGEADNLERRFRLACTLRHTAGGYVEPPPSVAAELLRICQEALTNVLRHANATQVQLQLAVRGRNLLLRVCDDGAGIPRGAADAPAAVGIAGMRERAGGIGASLHIRGRPGCGTIVSVRRRLALR